MKKGGILSLIVYIIYALLGIGAVIYSKISIDLNDGQGWENLGNALLLIIGIVIGVAGLTATIIKLLHMASGWLLFGILAIVCDLVFIAAHISSSAPAGNLSQLTPEDILQVSPFILASLLSLISNIRSLRD